MTIVVWVQVPPQIPFNQYAPVMELVDIPDLKSVALSCVWVRVPSGAPFDILQDNVVNAVVAQW